MTVQELVEKSYGNSKAKGFWETSTEETPSVKLALIHGEISEALEDLRDGKLGVELHGEKPCGFPTELADAMIRIADLAGYMGIDLDAVIEQKMAYNSTRPYKHNKAF
jgi:NTP pyrophosphatase (non-canonical NTP hydrolase)